MSTLTDTFADLTLDGQLATVAAGTAHFGVQLAALTDTELDGASLLPGWSRKHITSHIGYNAVALGRLMEWAMSGIEAPMYSSLQARDAEILSGARLPAPALRALVHDTAASLNDKWSRAPASSWQRLVRTIQGRQVHASTTVWLRAREVWIHAVDLDSEATFADIPAVVLRSLLDDVVGAWQTRHLGSGITLEVDGREPVHVDSSSPTLTTVAGSLASVVQWATGRSSTEIDAATPEPPRWL